MKRRLMFLVVLGGIVWAVLASEARAQAMPFHTPTAMPVPLAQNALRSFYQRVEMRTRPRDGARLRNADSIRLEVDRVGVIAPFGLRPTTTVFVGIPYLRKTFVSDPTQRRSKRGLGDAFLLVKQEVLARDFVAGNRRLAIFGGIGFPTGQVEEDGAALPPPLRLGMGATDLTGQVVHSHVNDRIGAHGRVGYNGAAGSSFGVRPGDRFQYDVAVGYRLLPAVFQSMRDTTFAGYLELNGTLALPARKDGDALDDTGGHTVFVSPGLQIIPAPNWTVEAAVQLPILRELRGTQLAPNWSASIGARAAFFLFGH